MSNILPNPVISVVPGAAPVPGAGVPAPLAPAISPLAWVNEKIRLHEYSDLPVTAILEVDIQYTGLQPLDQATLNVRRRQVLDQIHQGLINGLPSHIASVIAQPNVTINWEALDRNSTRFVTRSAYNHSLKRLAISHFFQRFQTPNDPLVTHDFFIHTLLTRPAS
jgi:hypothetical protein